jgi:hypothetical protein
MIDKFKQRAEKLSLLICNKNIIYGDLVFLQNENTIFAHNNYIEALHEIAHWIACDPKYRYLNNLGLPNSYVEDIPIYHRMMYEESLAFVITKLLFDTYFKDDTNIKNINYVEYVDSLCEDLCKDENFNPSVQRKIAISIFDNYNNLTI